MRTLTVDKLIPLTPALLRALAPAATGAVISQFSGSSGSPAGQGWTGQSGILSGAQINDGGTQAWRMTGDNCCGYWSGSLTAQQRQDAFTLGWSLRGIARMPATGSSSGYIFLDVPAGLANRFDIVFGFNGANNFVGLSNWFDFLNPALKFTFSENDYHLFDMRYDPGTQTASLWVDGVQLLTNYAGHTQFRESHGPAFGVAGNTVQANFACVFFTINDGTTGDGCGVTTNPGGGGGMSPVPEPATVMLSGFALALIAWRRR